MTMSTWMCALNGLDLQQDFCSLQVAANSHTERATACVQHMADLAGKLASGALHGAPPATLPCLCTNAQLSKFLQKSLSVVDHACSSHSLGDCAAMYTAKLIGAYQLSRNRTCRIKFILCMAALSNALALHDECASPCQIFGSTAPKRHLRCDERDADTGDENSDPSHTKLADKSKVQPVMEPLIRAACTARGKLQYCSAPGHVLAGAIAGLQSRSDTSGQASLAVHHIAADLASMLASGGLPYSIAGSYHALRSCWSQTIAGQASRQTAAHAIKACLKPLARDAHWSVRHAFVSQATILTSCGHDSDVASSAWLLSADVYVCACHANNVHCSSQPAPACAHLIQWHIKVSSWGKNSAGTTNCPRGTDNCAAQRVERNALRWTQRVEAVSHLPCASCPQRSAASTVPPHPPCARRIQSDHVSLVSAGAAGQHRSKQTSGQSRPRQADNPSSQEPQGPMDASACRCTC